MAQRENGEDTMPGAPPRGRRRDVLDDGEDVSSCTERELLLRSLNANLAHDHALGLLAADVSGIRGSVQAIERRLAPGGEVDQRVRTTSSHALEGFAETLSTKVVAAVKDEREGSGNITPGRMTEIVQQTLTAKELEQLRSKATRDRDRREKILVGVAIALISAAVSGAAGYVTHAVTSRAPVTTAR